MHIVGLSLTQYHLRQCVLLLLFCSVSEYEDITKDEVESGIKGKGTEENLPWGTHFFNWNKTEELL